MQMVEVARRIQERLLSPRTYRPHILECLEYWPKVELRGHMERGKRGNSETESVYGRDRAKVRKSVLKNLLARLNCIVEHT